MRYKILGTSTIQISSIGMGTNFVADIGKDEKKLLYLLQKAVDEEINFYDTAEVYHGGRAEMVIGKAFNKMRDKVIIATKFSAEHCKYADVLKSAEGSLKRLRTHYIDLYQIHWPNPQIPIEETLKALEKLVISGKVKHIGVSNFSLRLLKEAQKASKLPIVSLQTEYNLLERSIEQDVLPFSKKNNMTTIAYTPLNSGTILKQANYAKMFSRLSRKYNRTASQIILNFLISHPTVVAIPATTNITHLEENVKAGEFELEKSDRKFIAKTFTTKVIAIDTGKIKVTSSADHTAYRTIEEALHNKLNLFPSPLLLSADIRKGDFLKPVRVRRIGQKGRAFEYELVNGRIRYWAFVLAFDGKKPIPAIVED